jgi:hypothetical protein
VRDLRTLREISHWLTRELRESEADGCNWSRDLVINYGRNDSEVVHRYLRPLFEDARRRFNVHEP